MIYFLYKKQVNVVYIPYSLELETAGHEGTVQHASAPILSVKHG
jgi:hypothetical protein